MSDKISQEFRELKRTFLKKKFSNLNETQLEAVFNVKGPMVVIAGAGSGKTTAVISRIVNMVTYGEAYLSDSVPKNLNENMINVLKAACENPEDSHEADELIRVNPVNPWNILAITFTNKAANELKSRLSAALGEKSKDICASTFHSLCSRILRIHAAKIGYTSHFTIYDDEDSIKVIKECLKTLKLDDKVVSARSIKNIISRQKDKLITPEEYKEVQNEGYKFSGVPYEVYEYYQRKLKEANAMDFDDLIFNTVKLFKEHPEVLESYRREFEYILVDEYQDTNYSQSVLIKSLAEKSKNICVVGDDDQSIYKFRGASIKNIVEFDKDFENAKLVRFEQSYRSTKNIIDAANAVIKNNAYRKGKTLWTENPPGELIRVHTAYNEHDEANFIAEAIQDRVARGEKYSDCAVLYRRNSQSNVLEKVLMRRGVPYRIYGGHRFYDRKEIRDMIAYLSVINNPRDEIRLRRIINQPRRSIGERTISQASEISKETGKDLLSVMRECDKFDSLQRVAVKLKTFANLIDELIYTYKSGRILLSELYEMLLDRTEYISFLKSERDSSEARIENVKELLSSIKSYEHENGKNATLAGFLEEISLFSDVDNYDADSDAVVLMTLHASKGLEFPNVFIPGLEEGIFPGIQAMEDMSGMEMEEERRLAYVGITRCKKSLYLLDSDSRMYSGSTSHNKASRFLGEIPEELIFKTKSRDWKQPEAGQTIPKSAQEQRAQSVMAAHNFGGIGGGRSYCHSSKETLFNVGDKVYHASFGEGVIESIVPIANDSMMSINFGGVTKKLMSNYAKLEKR